MSTASPLPCLAIAGPTASGKTAAALALARLLAERGQAAEIISVDSALVYRGMDIGTAKPTPEELAACPHHLIDIRDPLQAYSAAEFVQDTQRLAAEIRARGALPLLVGGTMLYFKALQDGIDDMPAADPAVRERLDAQAAQIGWPAMHALLAQVAPARARAAGRPRQACAGGPGPPPHGRTPGAGRQPAHTARAGGLARVGQAAVQLSYAQWQECRTGPGQPRRLLLAGAAGPRLAACAHRPAVRRHAGRRLHRRGAAAARARRPAPGPALHPLRGLPPGLGIAGRPVLHELAARTRHCRHAPAGQAPDHLAAQHARPPCHCLRYARCPAATAAGCDGRGGCSNPGPQRLNRKPPS